MKNLRDALLNIARENIEGLSYEEALDYLDYDAIPEHGSVSGLIYREDIEKLARDYHDEIIDLMEKVGPDKPLYLNDMGLFAWNFIILGNGELILEDLGWSK